MTFVSRRRVTSAVKDLLGRSQAHPPLHCAKTAKGLAGPVPDSLMDH
jgi:hypothetical protein